MSKIIKEFIHDLYGSPSPNWIIDKWAAPLQEAMEKAERWDAAVKGMRILESMTDLEHITAFMAILVEAVNSLDDANKKLDAIKELSVSGPNCPDDWHDELTKILQSSPTKTRGG